MRPMSKSMEAGGQACLVAGIGLLLLLQGCTTPLVDVKVTTCGKGEMNASDGVGACNVVNPYSGPIPTHPPSVSGTICKDSSGATITCPTGAQCASGSKCNDQSPGTLNRKTCVTYWVQTSGTNGNCYCDAGP